MKIINTMLLSLLLMVGSSQAMAAQVGGVEVAPQVQYGGKTMVLNGAGLRKKFFFQLYVGSLYLTAKSADANAIINNDAPVHMRLEITSGQVSAEKMKAATLEGFQKVTGGNMAAIQADVDKLLAAIGQGKGEGDIYEFSNVPGSGLHFLLNSKRLEVLTNPALKKALFSIWLSDKAVDATLRNNLLGK